MCLMIFMIVDVLFNERIFISWTIKKLKTFSEFISLKTIYFNKVSLNLNDNVGMIFEFIFSKYAR